MGKLTGYFTITWLIILIVSFLISRFLLIRLLGLDDDSNEWWMAIVTGVSFIYSLKFVFFLTLSSVTIFLNLFKKVRNNWLLSLLTYSLIPLLTFAIMIISDMLENGNGFEAIKSIAKFSGSLVLPHLFCTLICFLHFRKLMRNESFN
ncbi:hypothetical protein [Epilithonimonas caeni]|uniref:hypothetical protein n=1 Tax=Epilithonimonas caeni TaxID=365343 RepID=UPI00048A24C1|nr:hypothetical protein [Epilithonimonas caeni]